MCLDDSVGCEIQTGRPVVITSPSKANESGETVIVAFITSQGKPHPNHIPVLVEGKRNRVLCNQVRTLAKERLTRCICMLTAEEMKRVTGGLAAAQSISIAVQKDESEEIISLRAECEMWKRLYERTMDQLVELKVANDLATKMAQRVVAEEPIIEDDLVIDEEPEPEIEVEPVAFEETTEKVDLNSCTADDLKKCGCSVVVASTIISGRPYKFVEDLRNLPGITNVAFGILKHKVCVAAEPVVEEEVVETPEAPEAPEVVEVPPEPEVVEAVEVAPEQDVAEVPEATDTEKVNINTAKAKELMVKLNLGQFYAYRITGHRNKNGDFVCIEELVECNVISKPAFDQIKDKITVGEPEPEPDPVDEGSWLDEVELPTPVVEPEPEEEPAKVNINKANMTELMSVGFTKPVAGRIVAYVKKFGPFRDLDELSEINGLKGETLRKLRDKLEV